MLQAPRVPVQAEDLEMQKLINTYGKTFHTWQVDRGDVLPFGTHALASVLSTSLRCLLCLANPPPPRPPPFPPPPLPALGSHCHAGTMVLSYNSNHGSA